MEGTLCHQLDGNLVLFFMCEQKLFAIFFVRFLKVTVIAFVTICSGQVKRKDGYTAER